MRNLEHGQLTAYVRDRCRCIPCVTAYRRYARDRTRLRAYGRLPQMVNAAEVIDHLRWLASHGVGWERAATLAGLPRSTVSSILYKAGRRTVTPRVAHAILAVVPTMDTAAPAALIDAVGTRRRLGSLMLRGHTLTAMARAAGVPDLRRVLTRDQVTARTARAVRGLYDHWWASPAIAVTADEAGIIARTVARAQADGFLPAMAWDDDLLDDPTAEPDLTRIRPPTSHSRIYLEDLEFLASHGATWEEVTERTGTVRNSVEIACARAGRADLARRISSNRRVAA